MVAPCELGWWCHITIHPLPALCYQVHLLEQEVCLQDGMIVACIPLQELADLVLLLLGQVTLGGNLREAKRNLWRSRDSFFLKNIKTIRPNVLNCMILQVMLLSSGMSLCVQPEPLCENFFIGLCKFLKVLASSTRSCSHHLRWYEHFTTSKTYGSSVMSAQCWLAWEPLHPIKIGEC